MKENTVGGIKYETAVKELTSEEEEYQKKMAQQNKIQD